MRYTAESVEGYFTFALLDRSDNLYFVKGESPLYLIHFTDLGLFVYSSTAEIMREALSHSPLRAYQYDVIPVTEGELLRIDCDGNIVRSSFTPKEDAFFPRWSPRPMYGLNWFDDLKDKNDTSYLDILHLCGYYGVDPETIQELREMGFSYDEIEAYLTDSESFGDDLMWCEPI